MINSVRCLFLIYRKREQCRIMAHVAQSGLLLSISGHFHWLHIQKFAASWKKGTKKLKYGTTNISY